MKYFTMMYQAEMFPLQIGDQASGPALIAKRIDDLDETNLN